jgi:adenylyltransferase/sulfurtransferase
MRLACIGDDGQARLGRARVLVVGCGALGTVVCEQLVRAGVGTVTVVDRDVVELSNLQRQTLFTERDAERRVPKAEAAKSRLAAINGAVTVRAFVDDLHAGNARRYASESDLFVDCLDNFESRYILNDCAVERGIPLVYGGAVGMRGMAAAILPSRGAAALSNARGESERLVHWNELRATPCLRCLAPEPPAPGEIETCETAGVLAAAAGIAASLEASLAIRLLADEAESVPANLVRFDLAALEFHHATLLGARDPSCPCCVGRRFEFLDVPAGRAGSARILCGRGAVEVRLGRALDLPAIERLAVRLSELGLLVRERHDGTEVLRVATDHHESAGSQPHRAGHDRQARADASSRAHLVVLAGTRETLAIVEGTTDPEHARSLVARYLGV